MCIYQGSNGKTIRIFYSANIYLFKVNNRNTRKRCEIFSKFTIKTPERRQRLRSGVFIVNFENISHIFLVFLLLTLNKQMLVGLCYEKDTVAHFFNVNVQRL